MKHQPTSWTDWAPRCLSTLRASTAVHTFRITDPVALGITRPSTIWTTNLKRNRPRVVWAEEETKQEHKTTTTTRTSMWIWMSTWTWIWMREIWKMWASSYLALAGLLPVKTLNKCWMVVVGQTWLTSCTSTSIVESMEVLEQALRAELMVVKETPTTSTVTAFHPKQSTPPRTSTPSSKIKATIE
jgi:hypothetical protein